MATEMEYMGSFCKSFQAGSLKHRHRSNDISITIVTSITLNASATFIKSEYFPFFTTTAVKVVIDKKTSMKMIMNTNKALCRRVC